MTQGSRALAANPYVAGNPVGRSAAFVGRDDIFAYVVRELRAGTQNTIVLHGQRRIGKTSILQELRHRLADAGPWIPVMFDLQDRAKDPLDSVVSGLAEAIRVGVRAALTTDGTALATLDEVPSGAGAARQVREVWLPGILSAIEGRLVLLLDEFDVLADPSNADGSAALFPYVRSLIARFPDRLAFVFVVGRSIGDLSSEALSVFKSGATRKVTLLTREEAEALMSLAERRGSLKWSPEARGALWELTRGHPFLTQQVCRMAWEHAHAEDDEGAPLMGIAEVERAADEAVQASQGMLAWLWGGLTPACRVVAAALAELPGESVSRAELEAALYEAGVHVVIRDLHQAPALMQEWDVLETAGDERWRFRVELFRRWVKAQKPLRTVRAELDQIEPEAEIEYRAALRAWRGKPERRVKAEQRAREALEINANHVGAGILLAEILRGTGRIDEAIAQYRRVLDADPGSVRPRLVTLLLERAREGGLKQEVRLARLEEVLAVAPGQVEAGSLRGEALEGLAQAAEDAGDLEGAEKWWERGGRGDEVARVRGLRTERDRRQEMERIRDAETLKAWEEARVRAPSPALRPRRTTVPAPSTDHAALHVEVFGRYYLVDLIAVGSMGEIFLAKTFGSGGFENTLVIKRILQHLSVDEQFVSMFMDEVKIMALLHQSNIVRAYDFGKIQDKYFIAMEHVDGKDVLHILQKLATFRKVMPQPCAVLVAMETAKGLDYLHRRTTLQGQALGIVHREISPSNIVVSYDGSVKIIDFGIVKSANCAETTRPGTLKGTYEYMSPEQASGRDLDHRSDIFSLGIVLHEMLTGRRLFKTDNALKTLDRIKSGEIQPPSVLNPDVPARLEEIVMRALARDPADRYQDAGELHADLLEFLYPAASDSTQRILSYLMRELFEGEIQDEQQRLEDSTRLAWALHEKGALPEPMLESEKAGNFQPNQREVSPKDTDGTAVPQLSLVRTATVAAVLVIAAIVWWMSAAVGAAP